MKNPVRIVLAAFIMAGAFITSSLAADFQTLEREFITPPDACKPRVFFFFENEVMDQPGITADLEALKSVGVGGLIVFAEYRTGMKAGKVAMFSKEYDAGMQHLLKEAERLGLLVSLFNCPGSSTAGGPWNSVEQSMKQFVWSETTVAGGGTRTLKLKQPLTLFDFYRDIAVTAYPVSPALRLSATPKISAPNAKGDPGEMMDGDILTSTIFRGVSRKDKSEIRLDYDTAVTVGRLAVHGNLFKYSNPLNYELETSEDGKVWKKIAAVSQQGNNAVIADFPAITGKHFRVLASAQAEAFWMAELDLLPPGGRPRSYPQFNDWGASTGREKDDFETFHPLLLANDKPLDPSRAIDLTAQMKPDGTLIWNAPDGEWLVLREGYTTSGKKNHPSEGAGSGYEVDKLNPQLVRRHSEEGLRRMSGNSIGAPSLKMYHTDSWEAGGQSWSENLAAEFERRNGYALSPFLPVLAGKQVQDADTTRRFLEDFRRTLQALVAESYYGVMQDVSRSKGLVYLAESAASSVTIARPLDYFNYVDVPAGEAWSLGNFTSDGNIAGGLRDAVSASHILGKPTTPVEVFTSNRGDWNMSPRYLKAFGDKILATGANQLVFHCYIHQPSTDLAPGWTMNHYGTTFNRHVTWWNQARPWVQSISRSAVLLRQGRTVADFSRLIADDESIVNPDFAERQVFWDAPAGYANDWMAFGNLINLFHVEQGEIVSSAGSARYRFIVLPERDRMTLEAVKKLHELVEAGGVILGPRPTARAGLRGGEAADKEFTQHVAALWGNEAVQDRTVGKGRVFTGMTADAALVLLDVKPDLTRTTTD
ncbi:MAG: glycosyl hydrolase, partial [Kiritimatiellales bacterium]